MNETTRIRDLLDRSVGGDAWHGPALLELLAGVPAELAARRPIAGAHSIWEIVLHLTGVQEIVGRRLAGEPAGETPPEEDWPPVGAAGLDAWRAAVAALDDGRRRLAARIAAFPEGRLDDTVPGRNHSFYVMLHGVVEHHLYHAGQIALLKRAGGLAPV
jgi:uncharacterized damage-inducible protein DinB